MKVTDIKSVGDTTHFVIHEADTCRVNDLRRYLMGGIETYAIGNVEILKNTTSSPDEVIIQRLELTPLSIIGDPGNIQADQLSLSLTVRLNGRVCSIVSDDIEHSSAITVYSGITLVKLRDGEELDIKMTAVIGTGLEHVKWMPVSVAAHRRIDPSTFDFQFNTIGHLNSSALIYHIENY